MPITTKYLFIASMDVEPDKEALFNEVYDREHVPNLLKVPGVISVTRLATQPLTMSLGGERQSVVAEGEPAYTAFYEIESHLTLSDTGFTHQQQPDAVDIYQGAMD